MRWNADNEIEKEDEIGGWDDMFRRKIFNSAQYRIVNSTPFHSIPS